MPSEITAPVNLDRGEPWVESRNGSLFFVNALLTAPLFIVLFPLGLGKGLRALGIAEGISSMIDVFPLLAGIVVPYAAWLLVIPVGLIVRNLRIEQARAPRLALVFFLLLHLAFLGYAASWWILGGELPLARSF
jgi:hypothetical protein